ncbi:biotin/lipoic acid binding domain protein [Fibrobacter succinogenes subsp. succinogenes S85]|jgi:biotin carboxyl carrier protein|uniref:Biotin/lipoic acid binding domain protein n=2 Tax=Fibrobacter succinogenes TaxID=833 RepID=C9RRK7_FIBSS|nr:MULTISPECIES: acetyl-CoA carboxylase biotin carboxyl carrier protein subunit [Fibrobacter]ACX75193.1 biotin/lipoyl attachment domain-containing protein [Fibrobacter succinogenes subsp. succinogenes S85]ADL26780.1 biotin/lipoic acid binding domain protein [Fibrobacter succinogenes subsp. succinogenes S85]OWV21788.1 acetyl-CoA carboxylase biotin carboxyl carrier protein subunit [Fibrobacter sp. UWB2]PWJ34612.1 biotin-dependent enzyme [Fibrobacter succinogenes subsp. elongatus]SHK97632.1 Bioti
MKKTVRISFEGKTYDVEVEVLDSAVAAAPAAPVAAPAPAPAAAPAPAVAGGTEVKSPLAGSVFKLKVNVGDTVAANQEVAVIEALKMENPVVAPCAGKVTSISVKETDTVTDGQVLMTIA